MVSGFVLDASVAAAWCFSDETTLESDALRESLTEQRAMVPRLWHAETANLLLMAERRQRIKPERREELLELLASLPIETQDEADRLRGPVHSPGLLASTNWRDRADSKQGKWNRKRRRTRKWISAWTELIPSPMEDDRFALSSWAAAA